MYDDAHSTHPKNVNTFLILTLKRFEIGIHAFKY